MSKLYDILSRKLSSFSWKGGKWGYSLCPFHQETRPSFSVSMETGYFHCFGCQASGPVQVLLDRLGLGYVEIDDLLVKITKPIELKEKTTLLPEYVLGAFSKCPKSLLKDGFTKSILEQYQVGFDTYLQKIIYPIRDVKGNLVAVSGRATDGTKPKYEFYRFTKEFPDYKLVPHNHLWGADKLEARRHLGVTIPYIVLCEGFKASLWLIQNGYPAISLMGTKITEEQKRILNYFYVPVILFLDHDDPGIAGTRVVAGEIIAVVPSIRAVRYPDTRTQPDAFSPEELQALLSGVVNPLSLEVSHERLS